MMQDNRSDIGRCGIQATEPHAQCGAYFAAKALRFGTAMVMFPLARVLEIPLLLELSAGHRSVFLDLMGGTGFAARCLAPFFGCTYVADDTPDLLCLHTGDEVRLQGDALSASTYARMTEPPTFAACLAGFHHLAAGRRLGTSVTDSLQIRVDALALWRSLLAAGGRLVIADVPPVGVASTFPIHFPSSTCPPGIGTETWYSSTMDLLTRLSQGPSSNKDAKRLEEYIAVLISHMDCKLPSPEPAEFFQSFVATHSSVGHEGSFSSPQELAECFRSAGFSNVGFSVALTPWVFESRDIALWFISELFAIGSHAPLPATIDKPTASIVNEAVERYLGAIAMEGGLYVVFWKLMYVYGDKTP